MIEFGQITNLTVQAVQVKGEDFLYLRVAAAPRRIKGLPKLTLWYLATFTGFTLVQGLDLEQAYLDYVALTNVEGVAN